MYLVTTLPPHVPRSHCRCKSILCSISFDTLLSSLSLSLSLSSRIRSEHVQFMLAFRSAAAGFFNLDVSCTQTQNLISSASGDAVVATENATADAAVATPRAVIAHWKPLLTMYMLDNQKAYALGEIDPLLASSMLVRSRQLQFDGT